MTTVTAFWMGPDQWMLEAPYHSHEMLFEQVILEVKGKASVTEQSDGWCRFDMRGIGLASVMELLCPINMTKFKTGDAIRTSIDHLGCFVICRNLRTLIHNWPPLVGPVTSSHIVNSNDFSILNY